MSEKGYRHYPQLVREYNRGRRAGFIITVLAPLTMAIALILLLPGSPTLKMQEAELLLISVILFSLGITFMARLVLQRMAAHVRRRVHYNRYRPNLLFYAMVVFYLLLLSPALWGAISYLLVRNLIALLLLTALSIAGSYLLTPGFEDLMRRD